MILAVLWKDFRFRLASFFDSATVHRAIGHFLSPALVDRVVSRDRGIAFGVVSALIEVALVDAGCRDRRIALVNAFRAPVAPAGAAGFLDVRFVVEAHVGW